MNTATPAVPFEVELSRGVFVLRFRGPDLTESEIEDLSAGWEEFRHRQRPRRVVVDLGFVQSVDDLGMALLQSLHDSVDELGGTTIFCRLSPAVSQAMHDSGLGRMLQIRDSLNDAIWTF